MRASTRLRLIGTLTVAGAVTLAVAGNGKAQEVQPTPVGYWKTIDDETGKPKSLVHIEEKDGKLQGTIVKLFRGPNEEQNPVCDKCKGDKHNQPIMGMQILWGLTRHDGEWSGGKILDPNNGKVYRCYIDVVEGGRKLKVRGYIGFSVLGRTQYWLREPGPEAS